MFQRHGVNLMVVVRDAGEVENAAPLEDGENLQTLSGDSGQSAQQPICQTLAGKSAITSPEMRRVG